MVVKNGSIHGNLHYYDDETAALVHDWGEGNFLVLKFSNIPQGATSVKVGLVPSAGTGLVELLGDQDMNAVMKISDKDTQIFTVETTVNSKKITQRWSLADLICEHE